MTDPQTPATEAGRAAMEFLKTRAWLDAILAIEAEGRADALRAAADAIINVADGAVTIRVGAVLAILDPETT